MRPMQGAYEPRFLFDGNPVDGNPVDENGEYIERLFIPAYSYLHRSIPDSQLITYTAARGVRQLRFWRTYTQTIEVDASTVVLSIDGACRNNGGPVARASWGVYAGPGSRFNACGRLDASVPQTSSRAEIEALARALMVVTEIGREDRTLRNVKIRCDSEYLCKSMSMWIETWLRRGGSKSDGKPVAHFGKLKEIHQTINDLVYDRERLGGFKIQLWSVPREENTEADRLANEALDEEHPEVATMSHSEYTGTRRETYSAYRVPDWSLQQGNGYRPYGY